MWPETPRIKPAGGHREHQSAYLRSVLPLSVKNHIPDLFPEYEHAPWRDEAL
jgi:hypothetical protein